MCRAYRPRHRRLDGIGVHRRLPTTQAPASAGGDDSGATSSRPTATPVGRSPRVPLGMVLRGNARPMHCDRLRGGRHAHRDRSAQRQRRAPAHSCGSPCHSGQSAHDSNPPIPWSVGPLGAARQRRSSPGHQRCFCLRRGLAGPRSYVAGRRQPGRRPSRPAFILAANPARRSRRRVLVRLRSCPDDLTLADDASHSTTDGSIYFITIFPNDCHAPDRRLRQVLLVNTLGIESNHRDSSMACNRRNLVCRAARFGEHGGGELAKAVRGSAKLGPRPSPFARQLTSICWLCVKPCLIRRDNGVFLNL